MKQKSHAARLTQEEMAVLRYRFGIGARERSVEEIVRLVDEWSEPDVRHIEARALRKLRHLSLDVFRVMEQAV